MDLLDTQIHSLIGDEGFRRLVANFYKRVPDDDILGPMYPRHDLPGAEQRLCLFLIQRFGGPQHYSAQRGHPRLRMRHAPFAITPAGRDRWLQLMALAMSESDLPPQTHAALSAFFQEAATFMINQE